MPSLPVKANQCPNCQQELQGENFCPQCGQKNDVRRITFWHFINESLSNFFAVDGRFLHTIKKLFLSPGRVPKDFLEGKRVRYMNPVRVYFLSSLLLLFILQIDGGEATMIEVGEKNNQTEKLNAKIKEPDEAPIELVFTRNDTLNSDTNSQIDDETAHILERMGDYSTQYPEQNVEVALDSLNIESTFWNRFLYSQSAKITNFDDEEFSRVFYSKIFWVLFLFLPVLALILHLLYLRRAFYYPEHLFFAFYTQGVLFILISIGYLLDYLIDSLAPLSICILLFSIYLIISLKRFYEQSWRKTIFKFLVYNLFSIPAFFFFFVASALVVFILL